MLNPRIAVFFMMAMIFSPGMFHAAAAYLPSSFSMCTTMLGVAAFMDWRGRLRTVEGIAWFAVGGIIGWPFSLLLAVPFLLEDLGFAILNDKEAVAEACQRYLKAAAICTAILVSRQKSSISTQSLIIKVCRVLSIVFVLSQTGSGASEYSALQCLFVSRQRA